MRWMMIGAALLLCPVALPAFAADADAGHRLAQRWCSSCHAVDATQNGQSAAPAFAAIAAKHGQDRAWLRAWLMAPHPSMPDMNLTRVEIDDVVTFLRGLAPKKD